MMRQRQSAGLKLDDLRTRDTLHLDPRVHLLHLFKLPSERKWCGMEGGRLPPSVANGQFAIHLLKRILQTRLRQSFHSPWSFFTTNKLLISDVLLLLHATNFHGLLAPDRIKSSHFLSRRKMGLVAPIMPSFGGTLESP